MNNWFKSIGNLFFGDLKQVNAEYRVFNITIIVSIVFSLLSILFNSTIQFSSIVNWGLLGGCVLLIFIYFQSRIYLKRLIALYTLVVLVVLSFSWIFSNGPKGPVSYVYLVAFLVLLSITHPKNHLVITLAVAVNLVGLYVLYFVCPNCIHAYENEQIEINDMVLTFILAIVTTGVIHSILRKNYYNEKVKVEQQKAKIENQHRLITDSLFYAVEIQAALMQEAKELKDYFKSSFMVWYPKDIISGDFYYFKRMSQNSNKRIVVVADCTGHGVPGALLTMLGISYLKEILAQCVELESHEILNQLRQKFIESLENQTKPNDNTAGMELALCIVDKENKTLDYTGANRPLYLVRDGHLVEYKPNKIPIGLQIKRNESFKNQIIPLKESDSIYLFTDGYTDQFSEGDGRKYNIANFKKMIDKCHSMDMTEQGRIFNLEFLNWKGVQEQIDDVLVVGFKPLS